MKVVFDGQLFLKGNKTGIAWCADNLIKELSRIPELDCRLNVFERGYSEEKLRILEEYRERGVALEECRWFNDVWYKLLWPFLPLPYRWFFSGDSQITQFFNYVIPPGVRGKKVTIIHDMSHLACPQYVRAKTKRWLDLTLKRSCERADAIVTVSEFSKSEIIKYMGVDPEKITVMPNAVDRNQYRADYPADQIEAVKRKYGITGDYFLYLGTIEPRKNIQRVIEAYAKLEEEDHTILPLILAGGRGWLCEPIYKSAAEVNRPDRIRFIGYVPQEDAPLLMAGATVFLFPSLYEGFGTPIIEAMACGVPVISSNTASMPEVVGDAGILVNPYSVDSIRDAMERVSIDAGLREELRNRGLERVKRFRWETSAAILMDMYRKLVS